MNERGSEADYEFWIVCFDSRFVGRENSIIHSIDILWIFFSFIHLTNEMTALTYIIASLYTLRTIVIIAFS